MEWNQDVFVKNVLRLLAGRPQTELNKVAGMDAVTRWKNGSVPSRDILLKTAAFFKCSLNDLTTEPITSPTKEGKTVSEGTSLEIMLLFETMRDRLNDQSRHIEDAVKVITRYKDELQDIRKDNIGLNQAIDSINETLIRIKGKMGAAAKSGKIEDLGGEAVNE
jgi:hypothetical protein